MTKFRRRWLGGILLSFLLNFQVAKAQQLIGTTGLMNIPTAEMKPAATFDGGVRYLQKEVTGGVYSFHTGLYYVSFTPFDFVELTFRETLLKTQHSVTKRMGYYQQDRSTSIRVRPLAEREQRWWPSIVVGVNDIYSAYGDSPYASVYGVVTNHLDFLQADGWALTLGYAAPFKAGKMYDGLFAGVDYRPFRKYDLHLTAEYDTYGVNIGLKGCFWKSLNVFAYTQEFKGVALGISYQHTIKF